MLILKDEVVVQRKYGLGRHHHYDILPDNSSVASALRALHWAVDLDRDSLPARWGLGWAAIVTGDIEVAEHALRPLIAHAGRNPPLYEDILRTLSYGGEDEGVIALYEFASPPRRTQVVSATVALAYLDFGSENAWDEIAALHPGNLYANYHLWVRAQETGDAQAAMIYRQVLTQFPLEVIGPVDDRLLSYVIQIIPELWESGLWESEKVLDVLSFIVWQHHTSESVVYSLSDLVARNPNEATWPFFLAELYHRRERFDRAEVFYRQVLEVDPTYAQAYLRLGMLSESLGKPLSEATYWYAQYAKLVPDDLLGLKSLAEACTELETSSYGDESCRKAALYFSDTATSTLSSDSCANNRLVANLSSQTAATVLREILDDRTNDHLIVSQMLDVPVKDVDLGPNLVNNGGFEAWVEGRPLEWRWSAMFSREPFNTALFFGGCESKFTFEGECTASILGFWQQRDTDKSPARAGYWYWGGEEVSHRNPITLTGQTPYVIAFYYRTERVNDEGRGASTWLSETNTLWSSDHNLTSTAGAWSRFVAVGWIETKNAMASPLLRSFTSGYVQFDNVQLREIVLADERQFNRYPDTQYYIH
jgi:tetratricopeptide (TPR) repeat protein